MAKSGMNEPYAMSMYGNFDSESVKLVAGVIEGEINDLPMATIEFVSADRLLSLKDFVGNSMGISIVGEKGRTQHFLARAFQLSTKALRRVMPIILQKSGLGFGF